MEPIAGLGIMMRRKGVTNIQTIRSQIADLTNGPIKLCMAMGISKEQNGADLSVPPLYVETGVSIDKGQIIQSTRVNVDYADEWKHLCWRFCVKGNFCVSKAKQNARASDRHVNQCP
jgi:DNA-3-methyladenine glycosylase